MKTIPELDRRSFLGCALAVGAALGMGEPISAAAAPKPASAAAQTQSDTQFTVEARFWEKLPNRRVKCKLCPRECAVGDKERGYCGVRENRGGTYYTLVHSRVSAAHVDPIEKKPLFHYLPGTTAFSIATAGCNVNCKFCQNWDISQSRPEEISADFAPPERIASLAAQNKCPTIAYTYNEPVVFAEFLMDCADAGHAAGVRSVAISNGFMQDEALRQADLEHHEAGYKERRRGRTHRRGDPPHDGVRLQARPGRRLGRKVSRHDQARFDTVGSRPYDLRF